MFKDLDKAIEEMEKEIKNDTDVDINMIKRRILDTSGDVIIYETSSNMAIDVGEDEQIDEAEADIVDEVVDNGTQDAIDAINNIKDDDKGPVGGDGTDLDDKEDDSGLSMLSWIMIIGGVIAVLSIIGLAVFLIRQKI